MSSGPSSAHDRAKLMTSRHSPDCGTVPRPSVISSSYAFNEGDLTPFYESRQCDEFGKLGLLGTTIL